MVSITAPATFLRSETGRRAVKYSSVSLISMAVTQVLIVASHSGLGWTPMSANFVAVSLAAIPAYVLNRSWVWERRGAHSLSREVLPFWGTSLVGLLVSTVVVTIVSGWWDAPAVVNLANLAAFGGLWVAKYMFLDRLLFAAPVNAALAD